MAPKKSLPSRAPTTQGKNRESHQSQCKRPGTFRNSSEPASQFEEEAEKLDLMPPVDLQAESHRKSGEVLRFWIIGSSNRYIDGLAKRNILEEKQLSMNGLKEHYHRVLENIQMMGYEFFTKVLGDYNETLIREFNAAYAASRTKEQKRNHVYFPLSQSKKLQHLVVPNQSTVHISNLRNQAWQNMTQNCKEGI